MLSIDLEEINLRLKGMYFGARREGYFAEFRIRIRSDPLLLDFLDPDQDLI